MITTQFTPISASIGGLLLGASALLCFALLGRIAGISGILGQLMTFKQTHNGWRFAFIIGMIVAPLVAMVIQLPFAIPAQIHLTWAQILIGGTLVGFGSALGSGCTSGHGICGIGRLSKRSIIATLTFMGSAVVTYFILNHLLNLFHS